MSGVAGSWLFSLKIKSQYILMKTVSGTIELVNRRIIKIKREIRDLCGYLCSFYCIAYRILRTSDFNIRVKDYTTFYGRRQIIQNLLKT